MRTCSRCQRAKPLSEFHHHKRKDGSTYPYGQCKECHREYARQHYQLNSATYKSRTADRNAACATEAREYIRAYLQEHPCTDCAESDIVVLQFDHCKGSQKVDNVGTMIKRRLSLRRIIAEIEKCEVVCANCHTRRTAKQFGWWQTAPL